MFTILEQLLAFAYQDSFFVLLLVIILYCFIFKRKLKFIELQQEAEIETESNVNAIDVYCSDPQCVRCNLYRCTIQIAKKRLQDIKFDNRNIIRKVTEALTPLKFTDNTFSQNPNVFFYRELQSTAFWDNEILSDSRILESKFDTIFNEFQKIHSAEDVGWKKNKTPTGSWEVFHLVNQGTIVKRNAEICPETMVIISTLPSAMVRNVFGNVAFSIVWPMTCISEHYGPTNIRLRCHLGLVCEPSYSLCVAEESRSWEAGKTLVFDDSFLHSVSHNGDEADTYRAVLILDMWHPDLSKEERHIIDTVFAPDGNSVEA